MDLTPDPPAGSTVLRLRGADVLGVLHRIGTQALADLQPGAARFTCFCDFRGRLLHRALVAMDRERAVWLLRPDAPGDELAAFVDRHVFREAVAIENRAATARVSVRYDANPRAAAPVSLEQATGGWDGGIEGSWRVAARPGVVYEVGPPHSSPAGTGGLAPGAGELERIALAEPRHGHEIRDAFTPFEVGLAAEVHLRKGCFTGQEALLRLVTYGSVRRALCWIRGEGTAPEAGAELKLAEARAGALTSVVATDRSWRGLAVLPHGSTPEALAASLPGSAFEWVPGGRPLGLPEDLPARNV